MLYWALVFLLISLLAGAVGLAGMGFVTMQIAWVLFVVGLGLVVIRLLRRLVARGS